MKIKAKGSTNIQEITLIEWGKIVKLGTSDQYEIIERNTVWGAPINEKGEYFESHKREFEYNDWLILLEKGSNHRYKFLERINTNQSFLKKIANRIKAIIKPNSKTIKQPFNRYQILTIKLSVVAIVIAIIVPLIIYNISNG
jgi:hypothetical protein